MSQTSQKSWCSRICSTVLNMCSHLVLSISPQLYASTSSPDTPALDPQTGKPQAPATKEKTFFQKYWIYAFAGMMIFAMMSGEEPQKKGPAK